MTATARIPAQDVLYYDALSREMFVYSDGQRVFLTDINVRLGGEPAASAYARRRGFRFQVVR